MAKAHESPLPMVIVILNLHPGFQHGDKLSGKRRKKTKEIVRYCGSAQSWGGTHDDRKKCEWRIEIFPATLSLQFYWDTVYKG